MIFSVPKICILTVLRQSIPCQVSIVRNRPSSWALISSLLIILKYHLENILHREGFGSYCQWFLKLFRHISKPTKCPVLKQLVPVKSMQTMLRLQWLLTIPLRWSWLDAYWDLRTWIWPVFSELMICAAMSNYSKRFGICNWLLKIWASIGFVSMANFTAPSFLALITTGATKKFNDVTFLHQFTNLIAHLLLDLNRYASTFSWVETECTLWCLDLPKRENTSLYCLVCVSLKNFEIWDSKLLQMLDTNWGRSWVVWTPSKGWKYKAKMYLDRFSVTMKLELFWPAQWRNICDKSAVKKDKFPFVIHIECIYGRFRDSDHFCISSGLSKISAALLLIKEAGLPVSMVALK